MCSAFAASADMYCRHCAKSVQTESRRSERGVGFASRKTDQRALSPSSPHFVYRVLFLRGNEALVGRLTLGVRIKNPCMAAVALRRGLGRPLVAKCGWHANERARDGLADVSSAR